MQVGSLQRQVAFFFSLQCPFGTEPQLVARGRKYKLFIARHSKKIDNQKAKAIVEHLQKACDQKSKVLNHTNILPPDILEFCKQKLTGNSLAPENHLECIVIVS